jgi:hypothetical protein
LRDAANLWAALESRGGATARDRAWAHPDVAPTAADLDDPLGYVERFMSSGTRDEMDDALDALLSAGDADNKGAGNKGEADNQREADNQGEAEDEGGPGRP